MKKIAITGGISSGKSSVCQFFKELGAYTVDADAIVHDLLNPSTDLGKHIANLLNLYETSDPKTFRKAIADKVFENKNLLRELENILHPAVCKEVRQRYTSISSHVQYSCFVVEMPLLFEIQDENFYDFVITVLANETIAEKRFVMKGFSKKDFERRMKRQMDPKEKSLRADFTILNNGSLEDLRREVQTIHQNIQKI